MTQSVLVHNDPTFKMLEDVIIFAAAVGIMWLSERC